MVKKAPTVGPSSEYMPPAIAAKTIWSETPMPDIDVGIEIHEVLRVERAAEGGEPGRTSR